MDFPGIMPTIRLSKELHKPGRRSRVPLSCEPCRARKLKCNREQPCQNCTARKEQIACKFRGPANGSMPIVHRNGNGEVMRQRIDHLEGLVKKLIADRQQTSSNGNVFTPKSPKAESELSPPAATSDDSDVVRAGTTVIDGTHSVYRGEDDWYDVLQEINNLKKTWNKTQDDQLDYDVQPTLSHDVDGSSLLFGQVKPVDRIEILSTLPPRPEVDKLIRRFFDYRTFPITVPPILHEPTFMREYNLHWIDPSKTNFIWLGLLFSVLGITMLSYHQFGEPPEYEGISESRLQLYRMRTAQCLLIGDIAKCLPYTVETLRFNATAELNRKDDNRRGLWIMTGVIVRAAINMGYHRDPSQSSSISVMQAEYRRRIWLSVISMDDMASFIGSFPRTTSAIYTDTMEPRNLNDWELSKDTTVLPPSRPLEQRTQITYLIAKGRLFHALGRITDFNNTPGLGPYDTVLKIDKALYDTYHNFPSHMKVHSSDEYLKSVRPISELSNLSLVSMYHKGMCILHRRFMAKGRLDQQFKLSQDRCISSALALLNYQQILESSWYGLSETRQMLIHAAMILFLELELRRRTPDINVSPDNSTILQALEKSCSLWKDAREFCGEAWRMHQILDRMLSGLQTPAGTGPSQTGITQLPSEFFGFGSPTEMLSHGISFEDELLNMDIDWAMWDTLIENDESENRPPLDLDKI